MTTIIDVLKVHALQEAHRIEVDTKADANLVKNSYRQVESFNKKICPKCWVKDSIESRLNVVGFSNVSNIDIYECVKCDFTYIFPKT